MTEDGLVLVRRDSQLLSGTSQVSRFEKDLVKSILGAWKDLRDVRKKQNFTITGHKLAIHKETPNLEEDQKSWK